jgi:hypothetical protein
MMKEMLTGIPLGILDLENEDINQIADFHRCANEAAARASGTGAVRKNDLHAIGDLDIDFGHYAGIEVA